MLDLDGQAKIFHATVKIFTCLTATEAACLVWCFCVDEDINGVYPSIAVFLWHGIQGTSG